MSTVAERKLITVLFADICGSTALGERLDPEAVRVLLSDYFQEVQRIIEIHGGTVEKFIGDAVMGVFGIPTLHEDDAVRAVKAAAEIQRAIDKRNDEGRGRKRIEMRIGVNTGQVAVGDPSTRHGFVTGDAVNVAAKLEQAARPGSILLGHETYLLVRDAAEADPVAPLDLKGKAEGVPAYELLDVKADRQGHARRFDSPFTGRAKELARLEELYGEAVSGPSPVAVTLIGEAAIGKSRLVEEFAGSVADQALVLRGRSLPYGDGITFWPIAEVVRTAAGVTESDSAEDALKKIRSLLPERGTSSATWKRVAAQDSSGGWIPRSEG